MKHALSLEDLKFVEYEKQDWKWNKLNYRHCSTRRLADFQFSKQSAIRFTAVACVALSSSLLYYLLLL
ncbi:hypothetical protein ACQ4M3_00210 [Leptolyngbya sp. AN03gr2]|uniref:hypothetical protein n=1 Tax=Leptolyngbya sp. AN10 TaxID=3423365 RepID=UPI003D31BF93